MERFPASVTFHLIVAIILSAVSVPGLASEGTLYVGWAEVVITPPREVALVGQKRPRIAGRARDPLTATVLALETKQDGRSLEQAVMISCDLGYIRQVTEEGLRRSVSQELKDLDPEKVFLHATHTHTAPGQVDGTFSVWWGDEPPPVAMSSSEYGRWLVDRLSEGLVKAWQSRKPTGMSWGLGQAVVGHNRRAVYRNGESVMYGDTRREDFIGIEGFEDPGVPMLFFWNDQEELTGVVINVAVPSQETEGISEVSADFWHEVRQEVRKRHQADWFIFPQCAASGDISPHLMFRKRAEQIMLDRKGISSRQEIALRIADALDAVLPYSKSGIKRRLQLTHRILHLDLPRADPSRKPPYPIDGGGTFRFHVMRVGDVALVSVPFELYLEYSIRIQARSPAVLTFTVQLASQLAGYLPTTEAVAGGGYSADQFLVGPEGGDVLVDEVLKTIHSLFQ